MATQPVNSFPNTQIARAAAGLYDLQLGEATMTQALAEATHSSVDYVVNAVFNRDFAGVSDADVATLVAKNVGITSGAGFSAAEISDAETLIVANLAGAAAGTKGATVVAILNAFAQMGDHAVYGNAATAFNAQIEAATGWASQDGTPDIVVHAPQEQTTFFNVSTYTAAGANVMRLTGNQDVRLDFGNNDHQIRGLDLDGDGTFASSGIEQNGMENNFAYLEANVPAVAANKSGFKIIDAYSRNPLDVFDTANNFRGNIYYDGTGFFGDGKSSNGNIFLGGVASDIALGGIGNDFFAGGGNSGGAAQGDNNTGDDLSGGRNADFFFVELSRLSATDGNGNILRGGTTSDDTVASTTGSGGWQTQDNDWILLEASDDDEPVTINLTEGTGLQLDSTANGASFRHSDIESLNASGNLYGFLDDVETVIGARATDAYIDGGHTAGTPNYSRGSTAQLVIVGSGQGNAIIGGYDNDNIDGAGGDDLLMGGDLQFLITHQNNKNLLNADGGLNLTGNSVGTVNNGKDILSGGLGNDNIAFESDGGTINGGGDTAKTSGNVGGTDDKPYNGPRFQSQGDTLWVTNFSMGRVEGATLANEATAQGAALNVLTTDATYRVDLGNDGAATYKNYGGANAASQDQTNYKSVSSSNGTVPRVTMTEMESVNTTGLGRIDYKAAGTNTPDLVFSNQQNYYGLNANVDLRGDSADNALLANTGSDTVEGRGGDDVISGGASNDRILVSFGDNVDWVARPVDANGDNLWDTTGGLVVADGVAWGQDFRPAAAATAGTTTIVVDFGTTVLNGVDTFVATFQVRIDGVDYGASIPVAQLAAAKSTTEVAALVNPAFQAINKNVSVVATSATTIEVRAVDSTPGDGKLPVIGTTAADGFFVTGQASGAGTYQAKGSILGLEGTNLEDDRLIIKDYAAAGGFGDRFVNLGADQTKAEINQAAQMVANFSSSGSVLAQANTGYSYRLYIQNVREGDKVSVDINGTKYEYTALAGETADNVATKLAAVITNALDVHAASGTIGAIADTTSGGDSIEGVGNANAALVTISQTFTNNSATYMDISASVSRADGASAFGRVDLHNQTNTMVQLLGFNGANGGLFAQDKDASPVVLFQGRQTGTTLADTSSVLFTAKNAGGTLNGKDAHADADAANNAANYWINGDDLLIGGDGNDTIDGKTGDDRIMMSKGTDTVEGGGNLARPLNSDGSSNGTQTFTDTLQAEERTFGTGTSFKVTLDGAIGAAGLGKGTVAAIKADLTPTGDVTTFSGIEVVRVLENNRNSELDVKALSDSIATAVVTGPTGGILASERLVIDLNSATPSTKYEIDNNADGDTLDAGEAYTATAVLGVESVTTGAANDTIKVDHTQANANNRFTMNGQQDNAVTYVKGQDIVEYDHSVLPAADRPTMTVAVQGSSSGQVKLTAGALGTAVFTDTLNGVEAVTVTAAATSSASADTIDLSGLNGATVNYGAAVLVGTSLGGKVSPADTVSKVDLNQLDTGGVASNSGLASELMVINGVTLMERVTGSAGDDRVIVADAMGTNALVAANLTFATYLGAANTVPALNINHHRFDLGAGSNDVVDYRQETGNVAVVVNFGTGADSVVVDGDANGALATAAQDRVDQANNVERYFASTGLARIDLSGATGPSTTQFSAETKVTNNEQFDPNGRAAPVVDNQVRGISVTDTTANVVLARFMNADAGDTASSPAALWDEVVGSKFAETVNFTNFENGSAETLTLKGGDNVVSYNGLTNTSVEISATIAAGSETYTVTPQGGAADTITITRTVDNGTLTLIATNDNDDTIANTFAAPTKLNGDAAGITDITGTVGGGYHLIDLGTGVVVEDVKLNIGGVYTPVAGYINRTTNVQNFENATGGGQQDRIFGNNANNVLIGGAGNDILSGGAGADTLTGGADNDRFNYNGVTDGAAFGLTGVGVVSKQADGVTDFDAAGDDVMVIDTNLFGLLYQNVTTTVDVDPLAVATNGANLDNGNVFLITTAIAADADLEDLTKVAANIGTIAGTAVGDTKFFGAGGASEANQYALFVMGAVGGRAGVYLYRDADDNGTVSAGELSLVSLIAGQGTVAAGADAAATLAAADVVVRAGGRSGQQTFDINNADSARTELVYTTVTESRIGFVDNVTGFLAGTDRIDLTALFAGKTLAQTAIAAIRSTAAAGNNTGVDVAGFFNDAGTNRAVVVEEFAGGANTRVFIDADLDGNFTIANDLVIDFAGVGLGMTAGTFNFG